VAGSKQYSAAFINSMLWYRAATRNAALSMVAMIGHAGVVHVLLAAGPTERIGLCFLFISCTP
jgi:hypothetical protein